MQNIPNLTGNENAKRVKRKCVSEEHLPEYAVSF